MGSKKNNAGVHSRGRAGRARPSVNSSPLGEEFFDGRFDLNILNRLNSDRDSDRRKKREREKEHFLCVPIFRSECSQCSKHYRPAVFQ